MNEAFAEMTPAARMRRLEATRAKIIRLLTDHGSPPTVEDRVLSTRSAAWLRRVQTALVDETCTTEAYREIHETAFKGVPEDEADEVLRRVELFVEMRELHPLGARSVDEALPFVCSRLAQKVRAREGARA